MFLVSLIGNLSVLVQLVRRSGRTRSGFAIGRRRAGNGDCPTVNGSASSAGSKSSRLGTIELLVGNLAASDLFVTFFCNMTEAVWVSTVQWYAGNVGCKVVKYVQLFGLYLSTYITVVIAIDRCSAVLDPMRDRIAARRRVFVMIGVSWMMSAVFSLPQVK
jgi:gonadotropin-releasing hormone receptor